MGKRFGIGMPSVVMAGWLCWSVFAAGAGPVTITEWNRFATNANGVVTLSGVGHGVVGVKATLDIPCPARITMKMRRTAKSSAKPGHFGVELLGGDGCRVHGYTHDGANFIMALHQGKQAVGSNSTRGQPERFPAREDAPWVELALYIQPTLTELHVAGTPQGMAVAGLLPVRTLALYGYHNDIEVKDLAWEPLPEAQRVSTDPAPSFQVSFDHGLAAATARGEVAPATSVHLESVPGVCGQAVRVAAPDKDPAHAPRLEYAVDGLFADHGTVMFWVKTDWDGHYTNALPVYPMLEGVDAAGRKKLGIAMTWWISFALGRSGELRDEEMKRDSRSDWYRGDWNHLAMVWSNGGWCKAYLNGLPYQQPFGFNGKIFANLDVKSVTRLTVGTGRQAAQASFDELKVYKRPLSNGEIYDAYRSRMPADLLMDRAVLRAGEPDAVVLLAAPGGYYMRPMPAMRPFTTGRVDLRVEIADAADTVVAAKVFRPKLTGPVELRVPVGRLPEGEYRVRCRVTSGSHPLVRWLAGNRSGTPGEAVQRSFAIRAEAPLTPMPPVEEDLTCGEVLFEKALGDGRILASGGVRTVSSPLGDYLEGGDRKMDRFAFEVRFPERCLNGRPVWLEVTWPDDKPRSMGLYLYPPGKGAQHRDRLGGGVQSGIEYPLTGTMQKTRYLFHPGHTNYLFEARAMVTGFPAALAGFRVYGIVNDRLPKLRIRVPEGVPGRRFGYLDEDETFDQNLGWDDAGRNVRTITARLLDYLDYTGQNAWQYPFLRYTGYNFPMAGSRHTLYPYRAEDFRYMVDALWNRGKITLAGIDLYTLPEIHLLPDEVEACVRKGWVLTAVGAPPPQPGGRPRPNHAHPDVRAMIAGHAREVARRFGGVPGVDGISFTTQIGFYTSLDEGYDDDTIGRFSRETGVAVPVTDGVARREFLTCEPQRGVWLAWRARQSVALFRLIRAEVDRVSRELSLYVTVGLPDGPSPESPELLGHLKAIRGLYLVQGRQHTRHRHTLHWGSPAGAYNDMLYDGTAAKRFMNDRLGFADAFATYFESFNGSLQNDVYASYFQNADVKPFGRYFLKDPAFAVAALDAQRYLVGAQPLGTWGREAEAREFAKAFCALPALPFTDVPGVRDPVAVRYLNTPKGTYVYAVSLLWDACESVLSLSSGGPLDDLSTGAVVAGGRVALDPFQLRAFFSADPRLRVMAAKTSVSERMAAFCSARSAAAQQAAMDSGDGGLKAAAEGMLAALKDGHYAEWHRLAFSREVGRALDVPESRSDGSRK